MDDEIEVMHTCPHEPDEPHLCPYAKDVYGDEEYCTCCDECTDTCADNV